MTDGSTKDALLGNGGLTVAARLMSVFGMPTAAIVLGWIGTEIWTEMKLIRTQREATVHSLSAIETRLSNIERRDAEQDQRIEGMLRFLLMRDRGDQR